jgi:lipopolysaccharide/colanic/teichoic acid biosynthesis glycosyltransferase
MKIKRLMYILLVSLSFPIWLPVMAAIAAWIKLVSKGPVFFQQKRIGYNSKPFSIIKFRSMCHNISTHKHEHHVSNLVATGAAMMKLDATDKRIIKGGRLLRALGLDELPQIFNVLAGDMSLVGPRPCTLKEFESSVFWQLERVDALPGLTGHWQVNGKNRTTFKKMIELDTFYVRNQSVLLDIQIILKTIPALFRQVKHSKLDTPSTSARSFKSNSF